MRDSHSPSFSTGRAFSAGNEPMIPALHWAMTSSGPDTMNNGAPTTGNWSRPFSDTGSGMMSSFSDRRPGRVQMLLVQVLLVQVVDAQNFDERSKGNQESVMRTASPEASRRSSATVSP